jgi:hypothetical protein
VSIPPTPINLLWLALLFGISPLGSFWMLFMAIRYEKHPLKYVLLAFIPYYFLAYYFERVRDRVKPDGFRTFH